MEGGTFSLPPTVSWFTANRTSRLFLSPATRAKQRKNLLYSSPKRNCDNEASPATTCPLIFDASLHTRARWRGRAARDMQIRQSCHVQDAARRLRFRGRVHALLAYISPRRRPRGVPGTAVICYCPFNHANATPRSARTPPPPLASTN